MEVQEMILRCALARHFLYRPAMLNSIMEEYGSAAALYGSDGFGRIPDGELEKAFSRESLEWAREEVEWCNSKGVILLFRGMPGYPPLLEECDDAPSVLYFKGNACLQGVRNISIVGTRLASSYGREACVKVIADLVPYSPLIVSGLAYGIDVCAHKAALEMGLQSLAVLPTGIDSIYPARHRDVAAQLVASGGVITEFPRGTEPLKMHFIKRNRIIAAISRGVVVVESRVKGGSMVTVELAQGYNRDVFAVPGRITDPNSYGCNYLIAKNVAAICNSPAAIPSALGWEQGEGLDPALQSQLFSADGSCKRKLLLTLNFDSPMRIEQICAATSLDWSTVSLCLLELELEGKVTVKNNTGYLLRK